MLRRLLAAACLLCLATAAFAGDPGTAVMSPATAQSGALGSWTVTYTAGPAGLAQGGVLRVQLPDPMHGGPRNSATRLQASDPAAPNYVSAHASRGGVRLETRVESESPDELVKQPKASLDGRFERYVFVVRVQVLEGVLQPGDTVSIVYGDTRGGSAGFHAGDVVSKSLPVLLAVDALGSGQFTMLPNPPSLEILPGPLAEILVHVPSRAQASVSVPIEIAFLDAQANATPFEGTVDVAIADGEAEPVPSVPVSGATHCSSDLTPLKKGVLRVRASVNGTAIQAFSNPIEVSDKPWAEEILWGDLHSHTRYSWDGIGVDAFDYARYTSGLDFYARTDHSTIPEEEGTKGLRDGAYAAYCAEAETYNAPPAFITLHAYEASFGAPYGHHNVYFRGKPGPLLYPQVVTLPDLWDALKKGKALTIPHHTGKFPRGVDLSIHNPEFRRNFEIYSGHGLSEAYDPAHPLAFEQSDFTSPAKSVQAPTYAQDAWRMGQHLSTVAASDDHRAKPGQPQYGLTAIYTGDRTRQGVFDALYHRRTYGTTGAKIILDFTLDDTPMGGIATVSAQPAAKIHVIGTDTIAFVELLACAPGAETFSVLRRFEPNATMMDVVFPLAEHRPGAVYYIHLRQTNTLRGRAVMAWSSPIWTTAP